LAASELLRPCQRQPGVSSGLVVRSLRRAGKAILQTISEPAIDQIGYDSCVPKLRNPDAVCSIG
jgi:hypothetical protein